MSLQSSRGTKPEKTNELKTIIFHSPSFTNVQERKPNPHLLYYETEYHANSFTILLKFVFG